MRCLLLHPEDDPLTGEWARGRWERVIDLGIAGFETYSSWAKALGCEVEPYPSLDALDFEKVRRILTFGLGQVVDAQGLDWWDLTWVRSLDQVLNLVLTLKFAASLGSGDEIWVTSATDTRILDLVVPGQVRSFCTTEKHRRNRIGRLRRLTFRQVLEILGDKYDGDYRWRRLIAPAKPDCGRPVVLLPSAYGNASRTALSLAASLPDQDFLLVGTRPSAWVKPLPQNAKCAWLSSYAAGDNDKAEVQGLVNDWERLQEKMVEDPELAMLQRTGCFGSLPAHLREGLAIRNCWANLLDREPIAAVLCADEKNPYTRLPVLLAQKRGIPTVACHHGALDGRYLFSEIGADKFLTKSKMEWDYMVRICGIPKENVHLNSEMHNAEKTSNQRKGGSAIIFFSEPYEAWNGRAREIYAEVLPRLARIAKDSGRRLVIKLHPFESLRERKQLAARVLSRESLGVAHYATGPITNDLMESAWFSVTVSSTAAVDCAAQGVPAFLCLWLDRYGFGYGEQFVKFGAAMPLRAAEEIAAIPRLLESCDAGRMESFSPRVPPELLRELLFRASGTAEHEDLVERLWA